MASAEFDAASGSFDLQRSIVEFDHFRLQTPNIADSLELTGRCSASPAAVSTDELDIRCGRSDMLIAADVSGFNGDFQRGGAARSMPSPTGSTLPNCKP